MLSGILLSSLIISGCNNAVDKSFPIQNNVIERDVKISLACQQYEGKVYHSPEGLTSITFSSPQNLKDFTISRNSGKFEITQNGLEGQYTKQPLPQNSELRYFMDILDTISGDKSKLTLKKEEEGEKLYSGVINNNEFSIILGKNNDIIRISMNNPEMEVEFKY